MHVLLIAANTERGSMRVLPLGLALVAEAARAAGHRVAWLDLGGVDDPAAAVRGAVQQARPGAIGVSVRNVDDQCMAEPRFLLEQARDTVRACRAATAAPVIVGGAGYSIFPEAALAYLGADAGVRGDGEEAFVAVLDRLERRAGLEGLPGVHLPGRAAAPPQRPRSLDGLPFPDPAAWIAANPADPDLLVPIQTRRGCPLRCAYCSTPAIEGRRIRRASPERAADAVERLARSGFRRLYFVDNTFNLPPSYALELCRELARRRLGVTWRCILYPGALSGTLAAAMAEAGCTEVSLGFESGSPATLASLGKRFSPEDVRRAAALLAAHGIRRNGFLLLGAPGETPATVAESLAFVDSLGLESVKVTAGIRLYPGTPLAARAVGEGVVAPDDDLLLPRFYLARGVAGVLPGLLAGRG